MTSINFIYPFLTTLHVPKDMTTQKLSSWIEEDDRALSVVRMEG